MGLQFIQNTICKEACCCLVTSHVWLFATPWTLAHQAPRSMGFSRREYGVGCHFLLQGFFLIQGWNLHLQHSR